MRILLDEQIDVRLKTELSEFPVFTVQDKGWIGLKNGALRERLNQEGFDFFVTADKNLPFQQNLDSILFTIILLDAPTLVWIHQRQFIPKLTALLTHPPEPPRKLVHIAVEGLSKGRKTGPLRKLLPMDQLLFV